MFSKHLPGSFSSHVGNQVCTYLLGFLPLGASCKFSKVHQSTLSNGRRVQTAFVAQLVSRTILTISSKQDRHLRDFKKYAEEFECSTILTSYFAKVRAQARLPVILNHGFNHE